MRISPSEIWKALTDPELHAHWWAAGDVRAIVGHRFELDIGQWGKQPCEVLEVEPERRLKYRFATGSLDTTITWDLVPEGSGTRLKLTYEGFNLDSPLGRKALEGMTPDGRRCSEDSRLFSQSERPDNGDCSWEFGAHSGPQ